MTEPEAMQLLMDLGYDKVQFSRNLRIRGVVEPESWSCLVTSIARFGIADRRGHRDNGDPLPDVHASHAPTREAALAQMITYLQSLGAT